MNPDHNREQIFFTIGEQRVYIDFCDLVAGENVNVKFPSSIVSLSPQQIAELGHLFIALSYYQYDDDSVVELIDGYGYKCLMPLCVPQT